MVSRLWGWIQQRWAIGRIRRDTLALSTRLDRLESSVQRRRSELATYEKRLAAISESLAEDLTVYAAEVKAIRSELRELDRRRQMYEADYESMRAKLKVAEEITIPTLVEANRLTLERYRADIDVQAMRSVGGKP